MPTTPLPEPSWGTVDAVQLAEKDISALCKRHVRPSQMTGYLLKLLQAHFYVADNINDLKLRDLLWKPDTDDETEQSKIHIEPSWDYDPTHLQQRPALYVSRGPVQVQRIAIRDRALTHLSARSGNLEGTDYLQLLQCRHQIICAAAKSRMALDRLSEEVFYMIMEYGPAISKDLSIANLRVTAITEVKPMENEDHENFMCGVQIAWTTGHSWTLKPIAPILKSIGLTSNHQ